MSLHYLPYSHNKLPHNIVLHQHFDATRPTPTPPCNHHTFHTRQLCMRQTAGNNHGWAISTTFNLWKRLSAGHWLRPRKVQKGSPYTRQIGLCGEGRHSAPKCLTSLPGVRNWSASLPGRFTSVERYPGICRTEEGLLKNWSGRFGKEKKKMLICLISRPCLDPNLGSSSPWFITVF